MPRVQRSPQQSGNISETHSEPNAASIQKSESATDRPNPSSRAKRLRREEPYLLSNEIEQLKEMLVSWKNEQTAVLVDHSKTLKTIMADMADLKTQSLQIQKTNSEIEKSIEFFNTKFEDVQHRIDELERERAFYKKALENLEFKLQDMELRSRSASIEIRNIPFKEKESTEDLSQIIVQIGLKLQIDLQPNAIRDIYRLPGKPNTNRPIIAEFLSVPVKNNFLSSVRFYNKNRVKEEKLNSTQIGLKCENRPIYVSEHLLPSVKKLYYVAREFAKLHDYKFCWCTNNKIFLRKTEGEKQIHIFSENCLTRLTNPK
ncbi:hypothetical protein O3G_MSEX000644 [Manduca sexta]|nr:hypothetical protein O3G_MSEX000644 [Manduca sexta]